MRTKCLKGKEGRWSAQAELKKTGRRWDTRGGFWLRRRGGHDNKANKVCVDYKLEANTWGNICEVSLSEQPLRGGEDRTYIVVSLI